MQTLLILIKFVAVCILTGLWWIQLVARSFLRPPYQLEHIASASAHTENQTPNHPQINTLEIYVKQSEQLTGPKCATSKEVSRFTCESECVHVCLFIVKYCLCNVCVCVLLFHLCLIEGICCWLETRKPNARINSSNVWRLRTDIS